MQNLPQLISEHYVIILQLVNRKHCADFLVLLSTQNQIFKEHIPDLSKNQTAKIQIIL